MNPLLTIADGYKRLRHTYGFGVHSPSAYRLVCNVLINRRGYTYYDFDRIDAATRPGKMRRRAKILHRLASRYPCRRRIIDTDLPNELLAAIPPATPTQTFNNRTLLISHSLPDKLPEKGVAAIFNLSPGDMKTLSKMMPHGILFDGKDAAIAILNPKTRFVKYTVRI